MQLQKLNSNLIIRGFSYPGYLHFTIYQLLLQRK